VAATTPRLTIGDDRDDEREQVWLITVTSSGFGHAHAEAALDRGDRIVATARDPGRLNSLAAANGLHAIALDVTDPEQRRSPSIKRSRSLAGSIRGEPRRPDAGRRGRGDDRR
jgi:NAD(P)-dependent dehydrogenase (short-subunit alcohol dehydrogenase family)